MAFSASAARFGDKIKLLNFLFYFIFLSPGLGLSVGLHNLAKFVLKYIAV